MPVPDSSQFTRLVKVRADCNGTGKSAKVSNYSYQSKFGIVGILTVCPPNAPPPSPQSPPALFLVPLRNNNDGLLYMGISSDGVTWTFPATTYTMNVTDSTWGRQFISYAPTLRVCMVVGSASFGVLVGSVSATGVTFVNPPNPWKTFSGTGDPCMTTCWTGTKWIGGGARVNGFQLYQSLDNGQNWTGIADTSSWFTGANPNVFSVVKNKTTGSIYAAGGQGGQNYIYRSVDDGVTWTKTFNAPMDDYCRSVAYNGSVVCVAGNGGIVTSLNDGVTWTGTRYLNGQNLISVAYLNEGVFMTGGSSENIWTSPDGVTWTAIPQTGFQFWYNFCSDGAGRIVSRAFVGDSRLLSATYPIVAGGGSWGSGINTSGFSLQRSQGCLYTLTE